jgi:hypothetical protein
MNLYLILELSGGCLLGLFLMIVMLYALASISQSGDAHITYKKLSEEVHKERHETSIV